MFFITPTNLLGLAVLAFAVSAISITLTKTAFFEWPRNWVKSKNKLLGHLVECYYCVSHWIALLFGIVYFETENVIDFVVAWFVLIMWAALISQIYLTIMAKAKG